MSQNPQKILNDEDLTQMAIEFENREFTAEELAAARRTTPRREEAEPPLDPREFENQGADCRSDPPRQTTLDDSRQDRFSPFSPRRDHYPVKDGSGYVATSVRSGT